MNYNEKRQLRKNLAEENTKRRELQYSKEIKECQKLTVQYDLSSDNFDETDLLVKNKPKIEVIDKDSVSAIFQYKDKPSLAVLNFASFKHPGGGYINGTHAQEECLCEESFLYNVLRHFENTWYKENLKYTNNSLYADRGLYTPNILFERPILDSHKKAKCGVLTVACPNWKSYQENCLKENRQPIEDANMKALRDRCKFILKIAKRQHIKTLILGAFGCGVFKQNPEDVANIFKEFLETYDYGLTHVVFAIPKFNNQSKTDNLEAFKRVFSC